jgi:hypothetical protein
MLSHFELNVKQKQKNVWKTVRSDIQRNASEFDYIFVSIDAHCTNEGSLQVSEGLNMAPADVSAHTLN